MNNIIKTLFALCIVGAMFMALFTFDRQQYALTSFSLVGAILYSYILLMNINKQKA